MRLYDIQLIILFACTLLINSEMAYKLRFIYIHLIYYDVCMYLKTLFTTNGTVWYYYQKLYYAKHKGSDIIDYRT